MISKLLSKTWGYIIAALAFIAVLLRIRSSIRKDIEQEQRKAQLDYQKKVQSHKKQINEKVTSATDSDRAERLRKYTRPDNT